jgi:hypothetical protein
MVRILKYSNDGRRRKRIYWGRYTGWEALKALGTGSKAIGLKARDPRALATVPGIRMRQRRIYWKRYTGWEGSKTLGMGSKLIVPKNRDPR